MKTWILSVTLLFGSTAFADTIAQVRVTSATLNAAQKPEGGFEIVRRVGDYTVGRSTALPLDATLPLLLVAEAPGGPDYAKRVASACLLSLRVTDPKVKEAITLITTLLGVPVYDFKKGENVRLGMEIEDAVNEIATAYQKLRSTHRVTITSGQRTPDEQATAMYRNFKAGKPMKYDPKVLKPIMDERAAAETAGQSEADQIKVMATVITHQMAKREFISRHLVDGGADFSYQGIDKVVLEQCIKKNLAVRVLPEKDHFHVQLKSFDDVP
ncbi:MAG: hypothetical protein FJ399_17845 [Verrucomicrobia bacterium]|nr:hypothetical protein [Verrucomicrobiota bacterium]